MKKDYAELFNWINSGALDRYFTDLYPVKDISDQKKRHVNLLALLEKDQPDGKGKPFFINAPGRTELGGNHTDHNHGCVLAAAVDKDCVAAVTFIDCHEIILISEGDFTSIRVDLGDLSPNPAEYGTPEGLIRGVAAGVNKRGIPLRGFFARIHTTCQPGTGLSSSAAFSLLIGAALTFQHSSFRLTAMELALIAKEAENVFFGKPCGLMDQVASSMGRTVFIDFANPDQPDVEVISSSFADNNHRLVIIDTGGEHIDLTPEYASIPFEMREAAKALGKSCGREVNKNELITHIVSVRRKAGDRAALRLLHFIEENERTQSMVTHLKTGAFNDYLYTVADSGKSSCLLLQNCATLTSSRDQGILLALAISERISPHAVCRVHGGGFAGTVQAYVPEQDFKDYSECMEQVFGKGSVIPVRIGRPGVCSLSVNGFLLPERG